MMSVFRWAPFGCGAPQGDEVTCAVRSTISPVFRTRRDDDWVFRFTPCLLAGSERSDDEGCSGQRQHAAGLESGVGRAGGLLSAC